MRSPRMSGTRARPARSKSVSRAFVEVAQDLAGKGGPISLHSDNPSGPALVQCQRKDFVGVLMPMRADNGALERDGALLRPPTWAKTRTVAVEAEAAD